MQFVTWKRLEAIRAEIKTWSLRAFNSCFDLIFSSWFLLIDHSLVNPQSIFIRLQFYDEWTCFEVCNCALFYSFLALWILQRVKSKYFQVFSVACDWYFLFGQTSNLEQNHVLDYKYFFVNLSHLRVLSNKQFVRGWFFGVLVGTCSGGTCLFIIRSAACNAERDALRWDNNIFRGGKQARRTSKVDDNESDLYSIKSKNFYLLELFKFRKSFIKHNIFHRCVLKRLKRLVFFELPTVENKKEQKNLKLHFRFIRTRTWTR